MDDFRVVLRGAKAGDARALGTLWEQFNPAVVRWASAFVGDDAEDLAAESWLNVARSLGGFEGNEREFRAWLFTIARNRVIDWKRRASVRPTCVSDDERLEAAVANDDPAEAAIGGFGTRAALDLIAQLPDHQAEIVLLRVLGDLDVERVARIVGKRPGNVRVLQHRALARLREILEARQPLPESVAG